MHIDTGASSLPRRFGRTEGEAKRSPRSLRSPGEVAHLVSIYVFRNNLRKLTGKIQRSKFNLIKQKKILNYN